MITFALLHAYALAHLGLPYRWGGDDPVGGYDCSGFVVEMLTAAGALPHGSDYSAQGLYDKFKNDSWPSGKTPVVGGLAFYGKDLHRVSPVAFILSGETIIEAAGGGRNTATRKEAEKSNAFIRLRPYNYRSDLLTILRPYGVY